MTAIATRKGKHVRISRIATGAFQLWFAPARVGDVQCVVVLLQLPLKHGYQVKYSPDLPGALSDTSEHAILHFRPEDPSS